MKHHEHYWDWFAYFNYMTWMDGGYGFGLKWKDIYDMPYTMFLGYCGWYDDHRRRLDEKNKEIEAEAAKLRNK